MGPSSAGFSCRPAGAGKSGIGERQDRGKVGIRQRARRMVAALDVGELAFASGLDQPLACANRRRACQPVRRSLDGCAQAAFVPAASRHRLARLRRGDRRFAHLPPEDPAQVGLGQCHRTEFDEPGHLVARQVLSSVVEQRLRGPRGVAADDLALGFAPSPAAASAQSSPARPPPPRPSPATGARVR